MVAARGIGLDVGQAHFDGGGTGKLLSPSRRRECIVHVRREFGVSERRACRTLSQHRSTQRKAPQERADEQRLTDDIIELADEYGRYGYRMVTGLLNNTGPLSAELLCNSLAGQRVCEPQAR